MHRAAALAPRVDRVTLALLVAIQVLTAQVAIQVLAAPVAHAAPVPTQRDERLIRLMQELDARRRELHVPGLAIAVVQGDRVIHAEGLGLADVEGGRPATPRSVWAIGSSSKAFTGVLAAMLVAEQRVGWDDPLPWYLPELQMKPDSDDPKAQVTFRDALSHRSGFARMGPLWASGEATPELVYRTASQAEPVSPFRTSFHYNNVIYTAAGDALGRAAGRPWDVLITKRLLEPLGMRNATLDVRQAGKDRNLALGYNWDEEAEQFTHLPMRRLSLVKPAGSINATVLDVAQWLRFQLARGVIDGKRLLSAELLEQTWEPRIGVQGDSGYAMGWFVHETGGRRVVEHGGNIDGFAAQVTLYPDDDLGYVLLMNTTASALQPLSMTMVARALLDDAEASPSAGGSQPPLDLKDFVGDYLADFGPFQDAVFAVSQSDGKLHVDVPGQMNYELEPPNEEGKWLFAITDQIAVSFRRDDQGRVTGLEMHQAGMTFELPRQGFEKPAAELPKEWARYLGRYRSPSLGQEITALERNGALALDVPGQMVFELNPPVDGLWSFKVSDQLHVRFNEDPTGRVESAEQYRGGRLVETWPRSGEAVARASGDLETVLKLVKADERGRLLDSLGVVRMRGTVRMLSSGLEGRSEVLAAGTDRYWQLLDAEPFLRIETVVNGEGLRVESNVDTGGSPTAKQRRQARIAHPLSLFADWRRFFDEVSYDQAGELDGRPTHRVRLQAEGLSPMTIHVDAETGDVLKAEALETLGRGLPDIPVTTVFSDHRDVGGLRLPSEISSSNEPAGTTRVRYESIETGVAVEPSVFATD